MFRSFVFLLLADMSVSYAQIRSGAIVGTVSRPDKAKTRATEQIGPPSQSLTGLLFSPIASLRAEQINRNPVYGELPNWPECGGF
jgi:hypothetical protein